MTSARSVIFDIIGRDKASAAFRSASKSAEAAAVGVDRSIARMNAAGAKTALIGQKMTKGLTLPLLALGGVAADQAIKFQRSMTLIQTAGGETAAKTAVISAGIKKVAVETGTSLDELGHGIYTVAKAGAQKWSAVEQLQVLKVAAQGAKAESVDLATATDALTTVMLDYHVPVKDAVKYENMLIRASGLAKTTFQEFSASLSNVAPIAAATGLSLQEVGGAIATMTQHGVSAQQATENLRNLIFNLSGQNNVAAQAMQQLGINTVDLAKNLGTRGLSGTLAIVDSALRAHTRNGLVVVDVHKAAALATKSLNAELGVMYGKLKNQSQGLLSGAVGISEYTKYAKSLGGQAGAAALQFLALYKSSQGFSNQLRAGNGTVSTTVQQYQKLLGGMTGAAVAMQIGGKYAKENARNVREVGKASLEAGSDVLGWNRTQDTLAVKLAKAKASLQVMAVEIGTALIPVIAKVVGWVQKAVNWFENLSSGQKKFIGIAALTVAALGPVAYIVGKVTRAIALMWATSLASTRFVAGIRAAEISMVGMQATSYTMGLKVRAAFLRMGVSAEAGAATIVQADGTIIAANARAGASFVGLGARAAALGITFGGLALAVSNFASDQPKVVKQLTAQYEGATNSTDKSAKAILRWAATFHNAVLPVDMLTKDLHISTDRLAAGVSGTDAQYKKFIATLRAHGKVTGDDVDLMNLLHKAFVGTAAAATAADKAISPAAAAMQAKIKSIRTAINNLKQNRTPKLDINTYDASAKLAALQLQLQQTLAAAAVLAGGTPHDVFNDLPGAPSSATSPTKTKSTVPVPSVPKPQMLTGQGGTASSAAADTQAKIQALAAGFASLLAAGHNILSSASDLKSAAQELYKAAKAGGASAAELRQFSREQRALTRLGRERDSVNRRLGTAPTAPTAYDRLATAKGKYNDEKSGVRSAITGSFDVTTAGQQGAQFGEPVTFSAMKRQLAKAVANAKKFTSILKKLGKEGLNKSLLSQLALAGPSALPEALALASATPKELAAFNAQYRQLNTSGNSAGKYMADQMYGAGVKSAQGLVNGLKSQQSELNKAIKHLADQMVAQLRRSLNMHSPSRRLFDEARLAFQGYENGITSKHADIARATRGAAEHSIPHSGKTAEMNRLKNGGGVHIEKQELHVHYPLDGDLQEAMKTLTRMSARQIREAGEALGR